ncbi:arylamine N-acetyltransferase family protein [Bradyrhizobium ganzhouense]|uniref:arylamine N-acetyltransferase family protein n=1 Tax=Bradyrhizobium ganzhouense TaxID=1179767 RepID=UPI003CF7F6F2
MTNTFDLDAYLGRIGYTGPRTPVFETLAGILAAHVANIPFEVFDVLLGRPIRLDPEGLHAKLITARRGGHCVEHATLMYNALHAIGFNPARHSSRVVFFKPRHESVREHMFLSVTVDGAAYVVDPGFGPFACPHPIPVDGTPVPVSAPTHRLAHEGTDWILFCLLRNGAETRGWISKMEEEYPVDFEMMHYYLVSHPNSFYTHNLVASAVTKEGRINITNQDVNFIRDGAAKPVQLTDRKALRLLVAEHFGFDLPELETMKVDGVPGWL